MELEKTRIGKLERRKGEKEVKGKERRGYMREGERKKGKKQAKSGERRI